MDCLIGRKPDLLDRSAADFLRQTLIQHFEKKFDRKAKRILALWGMLMLDASNLFALASALGELPESERRAALSRVVQAIAKDDDGPDPDEFALIVRRVTTPNDSKDMN